MSERRLPVRPNLTQLKHQAKDLLRQFRSGDPTAVEKFRRHHPERISSSEAKLADAQLVLARSYEASGWTRLVLACNLIDAIWRDDLETVRSITERNPELLHENAGIRNSNWGPPMSYAANLGRDGIIRMLYEHGARDLEHAIGRATLQGKIETARMLYAMLGAPPIPQGALGGPAYTLSATGTAFLFELGARVYDATGKRLAPVDVVLETDSRKPSAKHEILEMYAQHGLKLPDTPVMALHRGRVDQLEKHLRLDPNLLHRTFRHEEIYPPELGCHDQILATHGTPLAGTTLLHMCVDYDELEIARWLIEHGTDVNTKADFDADGFGGHTALFATVVSQPNLWSNRGVRMQNVAITELLLNHGAEPNVLASLRKQLHPGYGDDTIHEYRNISPLSWGEQFHNKLFVSATVMRMIAERGGRP